MNWFQTCLYIFHKSVCIKKRNRFLRAYIFTVNNCSSWLFSYYYIKNVQCKIFIPKTPLWRDPTGSSTWELLMCCLKLSRLIMMSLKWPSDTTAAQIGHCTNNGFRRKSADPYTFLTFALLSKNFLSSQAVKRNVRQLAAWTIRWTILR